MSHPTIVLLALLLLASTAHADLRVEYQGGGESAISAIAIGSGQVRIDTGSRASILFDPTTETLILLDHERRRYTRLGREEWTAMQATTRQAMADMQRAMATAPPEVRAQMEALLGGMLGGKPSVSVAASARRENVQGIPCSYQRVEAFGRLVAETCIASFDAIPWLGAEERATLDHLRRVQERMLEAFRDGPFASLVSASLTLDGFPLVHIDHSGDRPSRSELGRVSRDPLPAQTFAVPAGYREERIALP